MVKTGSHTTRFDRKQKPGAGWGEWGVGRAGVFAEANACRQGSKRDATTAAGAARRGRALGTLPPAAGAARRGRAPGTLRAAAGAAKRGRAPQHRRGEAEPADAALPRGGLGSRAQERAAWAAEHVSRQPGPADAGPSPTCPALAGRGSWTPTPSRARPCCRRAAAGGVPDAGSRRLHSYLRAGRCKG